MPAMKFWRAKPSLGLLPRAYKSDEFEPPAASWNRGRFASSMRAGVKLVMKSYRFWALFMKMLSVNSSDTAIDGSTLISRRSNGDIRSPSNSRGYVDRAGYAG